VLHGYLYQEEQVLQEAGPQVWIGLFLRQNHWYVTPAPAPSRPGNEGGWFFVAVKVMFIGSTQNQGDLVLPGRHSERSEESRAGTEGVTGAINWATA